MNLLREYIKGQLETVRVSVAGDVMFGRYVGYDYFPIELTCNRPFEKVRHIFKESDLSIANLETALYDYEPSWWEKYPLPKKNYQLTLVSPTENARHLSDAGINCVSLANNHSDDAGLEGFESTQKTLDNAGILYAGTNITGDPFEPNIFKVRKKTIIFFSVTFKRNFGTSWGDIHDDHANPLAWIKDKKTYDEFLDRVKLYRQRLPNAFIILAVHWGNEYMKEPDPWQEAVAIDFVNAGINCLVGHHPHVLQKVSAYNGSLIFFSLGNLLFDHSYNRSGHASKNSVATKYGAIYTFDILPDNKIVDIKKHGTTCDPMGVQL